MRLRDLLLTHAASKKYLSDPDFIHGIHLVSRVSERLLAIYLTTSEDREIYRDNEFGYVDPASEKPFRLRYHQSVPMIILGASKASDEFQEYEIEKTYRAFLKIREILSHASDSFDDDTDYSETVFIADTMIFALGYVVKNFLTA
jgi:hypothetical protein